MADFYRRHAVPQEWLYGRALVFALVQELTELLGSDVSPALGAGPTIVYKDSGVHYSRRLSDQLLDLAAAHGIPSPTRDLPELRQ